jgi:hypothetical protein
MWRMDVLLILLLIAAAVCFGLAAFVRQLERVNVVALGLLCWLLTVLIPAAQRLS